MDRSQLLLLGLGILLGAGAIGLGVAQRQERARAEAEEERALAAQMDTLTPLPQPGSEPPAAPSPPEDAPPVPLEARKLGPYELRVRSDRHAALIDKEGSIFFVMEGYLGAREVPGAKLFGGPVFELTGKRCDDPCNPTTTLLALKDGHSVQALNVEGVVRLDDLDADGVPEAVVDHLMRGTPELITLPFALEGIRYVPAYARFPDGVDRQIEALTRSAERLCGPGLDVECGQTLRALFGAVHFRSPGAPQSVAEKLRLEGLARAFVRNPETQAELAAEIASLGKFDP